MGLYPPAGSHIDFPKENATSRAIQTVLGNSNCHWNDLFPFALQDNKDVDQKLLLKHVIQPSGGWIETHNKPTFFIDVSEDVYAFFTRDGKAKRFFYPLLLTRSHFVLDRVSSM
jgi:hypothetical protein